MARKWWPARHLSLLILFNTSNVSSLFVDPRPHPALEDIKVSHVRIFNALSEE